MTLQWVFWYSRKHNDGRRNSGVGYNRSKAHLQLPDDTTHTAICGCEIQIPRPKSKSYQEVKCKRCVALAALHKHEVPTLDPLPELYDEQ